MIGCVVAPVLLVMSVLLLVAVIASDPVPSLAFLTLFVALAAATYPRRRRP